MSMHEILARLLGPARKHWQRTADVLPKPRFEHDRPPVDAQRLRDVQARAEKKRGAR